MIIERMFIKGLRNLDALQLDLHPRLNIFVGKNGSGKTSILEAFYLLSRGQSFRTHTISPLIQFNQTKLVCQAKTVSDHEVYLEKNLRGANKISLNQKKCHRISELSRLIPCQLFHQDVFQIIDASSQIRRRLMDWGLFYQSAEYMRTWQAFRRVCLQRNAVLKAHGSHQDLMVWNKPFVELALQLSHFRKTYVQELGKHLTHQLKELDVHLECQLVYFNGWDKQQSGVNLIDVLVAQESLDRKHLYTHSGPQHADIWFLTPNGKAKVEWSRGQQKFILILLKLAQAELLKHPCLFLFDDLQAELDKVKLELILKQCSNLSGQVLMTDLDDRYKDLDLFKQSRWFYLNQGQIEEVVDR